MKEFCLRKVLNCKFGNKNIKAANQHEKSAHHSMDAANH